MNLQPETGILSVLDPGPELCEFCLAAYHLEFGYRCADCDAPVCPLCVEQVRQHRIALCPECHEDRRR